MYESIRARTTIPKTSRDAWLERHRRRLLRAELSAFPTLSELFCRENLFQAFQGLADAGGIATGVDGVAPVEMSAVEAGEIAGQLAQGLLRREFQFSPAKMISMPKADGIGSRRIGVPVVTERAIARVLQQQLSPLFETKFLECSHGFRPQRGTFTFLAQLACEIEQRSRFFMIVDDIRGAFDNVAIDQVIAAHRHLAEQIGHRRATTTQAIFDPSELTMLLEFLGRFLRGHDVHKHRGLLQGNAYSPLALNVLLHKHLDVPFSQQRPTVTFLRYVDNLVFMAETSAQTERARERLMDKLSTLGLELKGPGQPIDIRRQAPDLLGVQVLVDSDQVSLNLATQAFEQLQQKLEEKLVLQGATANVRDVLVGWFGAYGLAMSNAQIAAQRAINICRKLEFSTLPQADELINAAEKSLARWLRRRNAVSAV